MEINEKLTTKRDSFKEFISDLKTKNDELHKTFYENSERIKDLSRQLADAHSTIVGLEKSKASLKKVESEFLPKKIKKS